MLRNIKERDGRVVEYDINKIAGAIDKAMKACGRHDEDESMRIAKLVEQNIEGHFTGELPSVEDIQDAVDRADEQRLCLCREKIHHLPLGTDPRQRDEHAPDQGV